MTLSGSRGPSGAAPPVWGYPRGVFLVAFTEFWERFSYWGLMAIFVLFVTDAVDSGGFGWRQPDAIRLYGWYVGAAFIGPLLGGWIANNYWGERRCILFGALFIVAGHLCLAGPAVLPALASHLLMADFKSIWSAADIPLGLLVPAAAQWQQLSDAARGHGVSASAVKWIYQLVSISFLGGLLLILMGTALIKPSISSIISHFFAADDRRREGAFGVFFVAIYVGCILGTLVVGYLGERVAWHWGFSAAALGMLVSVLFYLSRQRALLGDIGIAPMSGGTGLAALRSLTAEEKDRVRVILWQGLFTACYAAAFFQAGGLLLLFVEQHLDRRVSGWTIPASWLVNVATTCFVVLTPLAIALWYRLEREGRNPSTPVKLAWGLLVIGAAYLLLTYLAALVDGTPGTKVSWVWMVLVYLCFGIADVLVWPNQIAMVSRLAPGSLSAVFIGGWYVTIGAGTWATGYLGALGYSWGLRPLFFTMAVALIVLGLITWLTAPALIRLTHGLER